MKRSRLRHWLNLALIVCFGATSFQLQAQAPQTVSIDLRASADGTMVEVYMRSNGMTYGGIVQALAYTIKWPISSGATLGTQQVPCPGSIPMQQFNTLTDGGFNYTVFVSESPNPISSAGGCPGQEWIADQWRLIHRVAINNVTGCVPFQLGDDDFAFASNNVPYLELVDGPIGIDYCAAGLGCSRTMDLEQTPAYIGDPNGACAMDCLGQPGGSAVPGTPCDDGDPSTSADIYNASCVCVGLVVDCAGTPGGTAFVDNCGDCAGGTTGTQPCTQDCLGVWGGTAEVDDCGVCNGDNSTCLDCAGVPNGTAYTDACGACVGGTTGSTPCTTDCAGVPGGTAFLDNCGDCVGGSTGGTACTQDCNMVWGGAAFTDQCGNCVGGNTGAVACVQDCAGVWGGMAFVDECGACVGGDTGAQACVQDCEGVWGGTAVVDDCGVCNGDNSSCVDCAGVLNGTAYVDDCGACVGGTTGLTPCGNDCAGVPGGTAFLDNCGDCVGGTTGGDPCTQDCNMVWGGAAFVDQCGNCVGGNTGSVPCAQDCEGVLGGTAFLDNCGDCVGGGTGAVACEQDCLGVWGGSAEVDDCGVCDGDSTTCLDCAGDINGTAYVDNCGVCVGGTTGLTPCGNDCAGVTGGTAFLDNCGVCVGGTTGEDPCTQDCNMVWGGAAFIDDCGDCVGGNSGAVACVEDCEGTFGGPALPGTACDAGPGFVSATWNDDCICVGIPVGMEDCLGVVGGTALPGTSCDAGPGFVGGIWNSDCECIGSPIEVDCLGVNGGTALPGTSCDPGPGFVGGIWSSNCVCIGTPIEEADCLGVMGGSALPGTSCNAGPGFINGMWNSDCVCVGTPIDPNCDLQLMVDWGCLGIGNGWAVVNHTGGTNPTSILWSTGAVVQFITGLPSGDHWVMMTDANGCSVMYEFTLDCGGDCDLNVMVDWGCLGESNGWAAVTHTGGLNPTSILWSTGETVPYITGLASGDHWVVVSDATGCWVKQEFSVDCEKDCELEVMVDSGCLGENNGWASVSHTGGTSPTSILWSTGETVPYITGLMNGDHWVMVTDADDCWVKHEFSINCGGDDDCDLELMVDWGCIGESNGWGVVYHTGGTNPTSILWSTGAVVQFITGLPSGDHWVMMTDANGCSVTFNFYLDCEKDEEPCQLRTQTMGGWGAGASGNNPATYRDANFAGAFPAGLTVGCTNTLTLTTAQAVEDFLPSGGAPQQLGMSLINPVGYNNVLAGQLVALTLSVGFDAYDPDFGSGGALAYAVINNGMFNEWTVQELLDEANSFIGGCGSSYSASELSDALAMVNENFVDGTTNLGDLDCAPESGTRSLLDSGTPVSMLAYPVPASNTLWVDLMFERSGDVSIIMMDAVGRTVLQQGTEAFMAGEQRTLMLDVNAIGSGTYLLSIIRDGMILRTERIVISH